MLKARHVHRVLAHHRLAAALARQRATRASDRHDVEADAHALLAALLGVEAAAWSKRRQLTHQRRLPHARLPRQEEVTSTQPTTWRSANGHGDFASKFLGTRQVLHCCYFLLGLGYSYVTLFYL